MYAITQNGTSNTYNTLAQEMLKRGHKITIVAPCEKDFVDENGIKWISVPRRNFFVFNKYVYSVGVSLGKPDEKAILRGIIGADIVHILLPFKMGRATVPLCRELNIPYTGACHVQAENFSSHLFLENWKWFNSLLYKRFRRVFYQYVDFAHAPSELMATDLRQHKCSTDFRVITNGVRDKFKYVNTPKPDEYKDKIVIAATGRLAREKRQWDIIKAVAKSKYKDRIKLIIAGAGPKEKSLVKLAKRKKVDLKIGYLDSHEFIDLLCYADLYVHASKIELEGISCLEAMACGRPCLFSDSPRAAMRFYAHPDSLFKCANIQDLANKIDYYIENEQERIELGKWYLDNSDRFNLTNAMNQMEIMFNDAIKYYNDYFARFPDGRVHSEFTSTHAQDHVVNSGNSHKREKVDEHFKFEHKNIFYRMYSNTLLFLAKLFIPLFTRIKYGYRLRGKKNIKKLKKQGAMIVANHVHVMDGAIICAGGVGWRKIKFLMLSETLAIPVVGKLLIALGGHPTADTMAGARNGFRVLDNTLQNGKLVLMFPEASLHPESTELREFKDGAFRIAFKNKVPIVPYVITFRQKQKKNGKIKSKMYVNICEAIKPNLDLDSKAGVLDLMERTRESFTKTQTEFYQEFPKVADIIYRKNEQGTETKQIIKI